MTRTYPGTIKLRECPWCYAISWRRTIYDTYPCRIAHRQQHARHARRVRLARRVTPQHITVQAVPFYCACYVHLN